jgi:enoyl-[acyl-carrier protein] reductase I
MDGKRGLVMGVANDRSIAWGIAKALAGAGAKIAMTYQGGPLLRRITPLAAEIGADPVMECDVMDEASCASVFDRLKSEWGKIDFLVHAIAFSDRGELAGRYIDTSRENFRTTMDVSVYSFTSLLRQAAPLMGEGASALTLSYFGAEKVIPHYNVMGVAKAALEASVRYLAADLGGSGVRVNAISAGPIKTLAAAGIAGMRSMLRWNEINAPLHRTVSQEEVGKAALFLLSDLASGVTGGTMYVDAGYNTMGMLSLERAGEAAEFITQLAAKPEAAAAEAG